MVALSGGKDAAWPLHDVLRERVVAGVVGLVTTVTEIDERIAMDGSDTAVRGDERFTNIELALVAPGSPARMPAA